MFVVENKDTIKNPLFSQIYDRWQGLKSGDSVPDKSLLTKDFLGDMAGFSKIIQQEQDARFKYIAAGQAFQKMFQSPIEDKYLDEVYGAWIRKNVRKSYRLCLEKGQPVYNKKRFSTIIGNAGYEYILFPFISEKSEKPDYIASCIMPLGANIEDYQDLNEIIARTPWL